MTTARTTSATGATRLTSGSRVTASKPARRVDHRFVKTTAVAALLASLILGPGSARAQAPAEPTPAAGEGAPATVDMPPPPPPPPAMPPAAMTSQAPTAPPPAPPVPSSKVPSYILWGTAGASLILGASFGFAALSAKSDFDDNPTYAKADSVHNRAVIADVGLGLGAILAVTGTIFFFHAVADASGNATDNHVSDHHTPKPTARRGGAVAQAHFVPLLSPNVGGGVVSVRF